MTRTALVTGGASALGLDVCRALAAQGLRVSLTGPDAAAGREAAAGLHLDFEELDIASPPSVAACAARLKAAGTHIDVLVNLAAIYPRESLLSAPAALLAATMETNFQSVLYTCRAFLPGMRQAGYGRVVNVSSGDGALPEGRKGPSMDSITKSAASAATLVLSLEVGGDVKINGAFPGVAKATRSEGIATIVWLATLPADGPSGRFFRDRGTLEQ